MNSFYNMVMRKFFAGIFLIFIALFFSCKSAQVGNSDSSIAENEISTVNSDLNATGELEIDDSCDELKSKASDENQSEKSPQKIEVENKVENEIPALPENSRDGENSILQVKNLINSMTLEEKVGQLFILVPEALNPELYFKNIKNFNNYKVRELTSEMISYIEKFNIGGIILFQNNILNPNQLKNFTKQIKNSSKYGMFICTDEEGGVVARLANTKSFNIDNFNNMQEIGATKNCENAKNVGRKIGKYLKSYDINVDFAPVADVNTNPNNVVIGSRAFGSDPKLVGEMVGACIDGFHEENIITSVKHYPGHGDTLGDTHTGFVNIDKTWDELLACEIIPFISGIQAGTDMIMTAHISAEKATGTKNPSTLSYFMIQQKLRDEIGYDGVVITDSMSMGAIKKNYSDEESAVLAIEAGVDIILMPYDFEKAYNAVLTAVKNHTISEARIDKSMERIISLKMKYGILSFAD